MTIPTFLYGTAWKEDATERLTRLAIDAGFRGIDTANQRRHYHEAGVGEALASRFMADGAGYSDPEFSWKWEVAPGGIGFAGTGLGAAFDGDLFVGAATPQLAGGYLFRFDLTGNRRKIAVDDPRLEDRVADNVAKHEITESESLLVGRDFGVVTDIETGPNGNLFVVSLSEGTVFEIFRK